MEFNQDTLQEFKENQKTQFLASQFESELVKLREAEELADSDPEMAVLAEEEITRLTAQLQNQFAEMEHIIEANKEEEAKPFGVMLEVRAGAGTSLSDPLPGLQFRLYRAHRGGTGGRYEHHSPYHLFRHLSVPGHGPLREGEGHIQRR